MEVFELATKYDELRTRKAKAEEELKEINAELDNTQIDLYEAMKEQGLKNFSLDGKQFIAQRSLYCSPAADSKVAVYEALKANGYESLVHETVNAQTFAATIREMVGDVSEALSDQEALAALGPDAEFLDDSAKEMLLINAKLPEWLQGMVNVALRKQVQVRKASR